MVDDENRRVIWKGVTEGLQICKTKLLSKPNWSRCKLKRMRGNGGRIIVCVDKCNGMSAL